MYIRMYVWYIGTIFSSLLTVFIINDKYDDDGVNVVVVVVLVDISATAGVGAAAVGAETTVGLTHAAAHGVKCRYY